MLPKDEFGEDVFLKSKTLQKPTGTVQLEFSWYEDQIELGI